MRHWKFLVPVLLLLASSAFGSVIINEIMQNPAAVGDNSGEWFELYNSSDTEVDINGWTISDNDNDSHQIAAPAPLIIPPDGFIVLGNNMDFATNGGVDVAYQYSDWFLSNSSDEVVITDAEGFEVDRVEYDNGATFPDPTGASMYLISPELDNNVGENWAESTTPWEGGAGDFGTPGAPNTAPPEPANLVINEIMQNPSAVADSDGEYLELYNAGEMDADINGWTIADNDGNIHVIDNGGPLVVTAGGYLVLGINADIATNGGVPVDYQYADFYLGNSSDEVVLFDANGVEQDRVEYDNGATFPDPAGASMYLINPDLDNNVGENWAESTQPWPGGAGDFGTPGFYNLPDTFTELQNGGFELWTDFGAGGPPDNWLTSGADFSASQEDVDIHGGTYSANAAWTSVGLKTLHQDIYEPVIGNTFEFAVWVLDNDVQGQALCELKMFDADGVELADYLGQPSVDMVGWQQLSVSGDVPEGADHARVIIRFEDTVEWVDGATVLVDDATYMDVTPPDVYTIEEIQTNPDLMGAFVAFQGIVTQPANSCHTGFTDVYVQDETGYGVMLYDDSPVAGDGMMRGDLVSVVGTVSEYYSVTEIIDFTWELISAGNPMPAAMAFTTGDFANAQAWEGTWATITGVLQNDPGEGSYNLTVDDGSGEAVVRIWADAALDLTPIAAGDEVTFFGTIDLYHDVPQLQPSLQEDVVGGEVPPEQLTIPLQGHYFELISTYLVPEVLDAAVVFGGVENLAIVYQDDGGIFIPPGINTIGDIDVHLGYQIFCEVASEITFEGPRIDPETEYTLNAGPWNWLGYPYDTEEPIDFVLGAIADQVVIVMTDDGGIWIPPAINTIGNMSPGEGYFVIVSEDVTFQYIMPILRNAGSGSDVWEIPQAADAPAPTGLPYAVLVTLDRTLRNQDASTIELYDGGLLVGKAVVLEDHDMTPLIAWGGAPDYGVSGFQAGDEMSFRVLDSRGTELAAVSAGDVPGFGEGAYASVTLSAGESALPENYAIQSIYPNPFNPATTVRVALPETADLKVAVYNLMGEKVVLLANRRLSAGYHTFTFRADRLSSGVYFIQAHVAGKMNDIRKVVLVK